MLTPSQAAWGLSALSLVGAAWAPTLTRLGDKFGMRLQPALPAIDLDQSRRRARRQDQAVKECRQTLARAGQARRSWPVNSNMLAPSSRGAGTPVKRCAPQHWPCSRVGHPQPVEATLLEPGADVGDQVQAPSEARVQTTVPASAHSWAQ